MFEFKFATIYFVEKLPKKDAAYSAGTIIPWTICLSEEKAKQNLLTIVDNNKSELYCDNDYSIGSMIICN